MLTTSGAVLGGGFDAANLSVSAFGEFQPAEWEFDLSTNAGSVAVLFMPITAVPEPSLLLAAAALGLVGWYRRRNQVARMDGRAVRWLRR